MRVANRSTGEEVVGEVRLYGLDAELYRKAEAKRDRDFEAALGKWIEDVVEEQFAFPDDIIESLRSGIMLCRLVNRIRPDSVKKINLKPIPLLEMENIGLYLKACWALGVPSAELFVTSDLYRRKDESQVFVNIHSVARIAWRIPSFTGPKFGSQGLLSTKRETKWTGAIKEQPAIYVSDLEEAERRAADHQFEMERKAALPKPGEDPERANKILQQQLFAEQAKRKEAEQQLAALKEGKKGVGFSSSASDSAALEKELAKLRKQLEIQQKEKEEEVNRWKRKWDIEKEDYEKQIKALKDKDEKEAAKKRLEKLESKRKLREDQDKDLNAKEDAIRQALQKEFERKQAILEETIAEMKKELECEKKLREEHKQYWKIRSGTLTGHSLDSEMEKKEKQIEDERKEKSLLQSQLREAKESYEGKTLEMKRLERAMEKAKQEVLDLNKTIAKQEAQIQILRANANRNESSVLEIEKLKRLIQEQEKELAIKDSQLKEARGMTNNVRVTSPVVSPKGKEKMDMDTLETRSRRLTKIVSKKAVNNAFLTAVDDEDKLGKEAIDGMNHTITRILFSSAAVSREDIVPFLSMFESDFGRRQLAFTLKTALDKIPSVVLSPESYNLMVELLSAVLKAIDASSAKDFITTKVIMQAASRLCTKDTDDKTIAVQQKVKQYKTWKNIDYWEEIFWDSLATQHRHTQTEEEDDVDAALVYGVLKTLAVNMATWDLPLSAIRNFVTSMCDTNQLPLNIKNHLMDVLEDELVAPRGGGSLIQKLYGSKRKKKDAEKGRRELRRLFEENEQKGSKKYIASPGGRVRATILLPGNMNERPICEMGEQCQSADPLHFLNYQHTSPTDAPVSSRTEERPEPSSSKSPEGGGQRAWRHSRNVADDRDDPRRRNTSAKPAPDDERLTLSRSRNATESQMPKKKQNN